MDTLSFKTKSLNRETVRKEWYIVDATDQVLGRLSSKIAMVLRGKNKPSFTPHVDCGDHVIVINAEKIKVTGNKSENKEYIRHTGYPGGQRSETLAHLMKRAPELVIERAVSGMLPKNRLSRAIIKNLYVYSGPSHPHEAQKPKELKLNKK